MFAEECGEKIFETICHNVDNAVLKNRCQIPDLYHFENFLLYGKQDNHFLKGTKNGIHFKFLFRGIYPSITSAIANKTNIIAKTKIRRNRPSPRSKRMKCNNVL